MNSEINTRRKNVVEYLEGEDVTEESDRELMFKMYDYQKNRLKNKLTNIQGFAALSVLLSLITLIIIIVVLVKLS